MKKLHALPYWGGDGRNHILLNLARRDLSIESGNVLSEINTGRAMIVQSTFERQLYREGFDLVVPPILGPPGGDIWQDCAYMLPARRKFLLSFQGELRPLRRMSEITRVDDAEIDIERLTVNANNLDNFIIEHLKDMSTGNTLDQFFIQFECVPASDEKPHQSTEIVDWALCGTDSSRRAVLKQSTFALILAPSNTSFVSTSSMQARLYEALRCGAIPVILGGDQVVLSYREVIAWKKAAIFLPKVRKMQENYEVVIFFGVNCLCSFFIWF